MDTAQTIRERAAAAKQHVAAHQPLAHLFTLLPSQLEKIADGRSTYEKERNA